MITPMVEIIVWTGLITFVILLALIVRFYVKKYRSLKKDYSEQVIKNTRLQEELREKSLSCGGPLYKQSLRIPQGPHSKAESKNSSQASSREDDGFLTDSICQEDLREAKLDKLSSRYCDDTQKRYSAPASRGENRWYDS